MKLVLTFAILTMGILSSISQEFVIVDDSISGGISFPFPDTILSSLYPDAGPCIDWPDYHYFDLDNDLKDDISVYAHCYMGGMGNQSHIEFASYNDFTTLIDTNFLTEFQNYDSTWIGTYPVVKTYHPGDTINSYQETSQYPTNIVAISEGYEPPRKYIYVDDFIGDTSYVAFKKERNGVISFYYIKIYIPSKYRIHLFSGKTTDMTVSLLERPSIPYKTLSVEYYDLFGREISKPTNGFYIERKTTNKGVISKKYFIK